MGDALIHLSGHKDDAEDFQKLIFFPAIIQDCDEAERQRHHLLEPTGHV